MDVTTKAIALKSTDYKENDKLILLYSLEYGKITVHARGIKKNTAKLKFAGDQFCFGQYELAENGDRFVLKTCQQLESFFSLREDIVAYYSASVIAESLINYADEGEADATWFVEVLRTFEALCTGTEPLTVTIKYLLDLIRNVGFELVFDGCSVCGSKNFKAYLDFEKGGVVCADCRSADSMPLSSKVYATLSLIDGVGFDKLKNLSLTVETLKDCLDSLGKYLSRNLSPLKCLTELIKIA